MVLGEGSGTGQWKLAMSEWVIRSHPSTSTNSRILNGSEMNVGGSIIIPTLINVEETIRSMIRNGRKIRNPIWNAVLSSLMMNAGMSTYVGTWARVCGVLIFDRLTNSVRSLLSTWRNMNSRS